MFSSVFGVWICETVVSWMQGSFDTWIWIGDVIPDWLKELERKRRPQPSEQK